MDDAVKQVGPEVIRRVGLHSTVIGCHFMHADVLTGQFGRSFWYMYILTTHVNHDHQIIISLCILKTKS